jgi:hypothetical protein
MSLASALLCHWRDPAFGFTAYLRKQDDRGPAQLYKPLRKGTSRVEPKLVGINAASNSEIKFV